MSFFLSIIILLLLSGLLVYSNNQYRSISDKLYCLIAFLILLFFHSVIDISLLPDQSVYMMYFEQVIALGPMYYLSGENFGAMEPGYTIFNYICSLISNNYFIVILLSSFLMMFGYAFMFYKHSKIVWISFFLMVCVIFCQSLFVVRQHMALAVTLLSVPFIIQRRILPFIIMMCISFSLHYSSIIFFPVYFLYRAKINNRLYIYLFLTTAFVKFSINVFLYFLGSNGIYASYTINSGESTNFTSLIINVLILALLLYSVQLKKLSGYDKFFYICFLVNICLSFATAGTTFSLASRALLYFDIYSFFLIPFALSRFKNPGRLILILIICSCYSVLLINTINREIEMGVKFQL